MPVRVALISDIHENLPALEAVMQDIRRREVDQILCLGDMIGKGPSTREVVELCRSVCSAVVKGNWEHLFHRRLETLRAGQLGDALDRALWPVLGSLSPEQVEYLGALPHSVELRLGGRLVRLFHAHPRDFTRYMPHSPVEQRMELFEYSEHSESKALADVAVYADIHNAYMQVLQGRILVNTGSVGNPLDITQASYVLLEGEDGDPASFNIAFIRVPYDIDRAIAMAEACAIPYLEGYISELRTAKYFNRVLAESEKALPRAYGQ